MLHSLIDWYLGALATADYPRIALLMAMESTVLPIPSEVVIPPVAHLAHSGQTQLGLVGIVVAGTIGSWIGATIMYWAARLAGRPMVIRYGRYVLVPAEKVEGAERWASHYGSVGVFIARLMPVVRHLIGIPAGIVRMDYRLFSAFTLGGSAIWCAVLCYIGIKMGQDQGLMKGKLHSISLWLGGAMFVLGAMYYFFVHRHLRAGRVADVPARDKAAP